MKKTSWLEENMGLCGTKLNTDDIGDDLKQAVERYMQYTVQAQKEITHRVLLQLIQGVERVPRIEPVPPRLERHVALGGNN